LTPVTQKKTAREKKKKQPIENVNYSIREETPMAKLWARIWPGGRTTGGE